MKRSGRIVIMQTAGPMLFAGLAWGGWAYFINREADNALATSVVQALYSATMTLYFSLSVLFFVRRTHKYPLALFSPTLLTVGHAGALLALIHTLNQTQNVVTTIAPPLTVATAYCFFLTLQLRKRP